MFCVNCEGSFLTSIIACERGLSRQNLIKDVQRTKLSLVAIHGLMRVPLIGLDSLMVEYDRVYEI